MPTDPQRCSATRKDGRPCRARAGSSGLCVGHRPQAGEARRKGGKASARSARLGKLVPPRLLWVFERLEQALADVHEGSLEARRAQAMAVLAGAMVRVLTAGELEQRLRELESARAARTKGGNESRGTSDKVASA